jgi:hypothetical protein
MQRDKVKIPNARLYYPLWWTDCDSCGKQFRWEWGWRSRVPVPDFALVRTDRVICGRCAPDAVAAEVISDGLGKRRPGPPMPAVPRSAVPPPPPDGPPVRIGRDTDEV